MRNRRNCARFASCWQSEKAIASEEPKSSGKRPEKALSLLESNEKEHLPAPARPATRADINKEDRDARDHLPGSMPPCAQAIIEQVLASARQDIKAESFFRQIAIRIFMSRQQSPVFLLPVFFPTDADVALNRIMILP
jgi:hypothetical protein